MHGTMNIPRANVDIFFAIFTTCKPDNNLALIRAAVHPMMIIVIVTVCGLEHLGRMQACRQDRLQRYALLSSSSHLSFIFLSSCRC